MMKTGSSDREAIMPWAEQDGDQETSRLSAKKLERLQNRGVTFRSTETGYEIVRPIPYEVRFSKKARQRRNGEESNQ